MTAAGGGGAGRAGRTGGGAGRADPGQRRSAGQQQVQRANADLKAANDRERQRFDLAMEAIKLFHGEVSEDLLLKEKQFEGLRTGC